MTNPLRIVVLAALTVFVVSSFPTTGSAIAPHSTHHVIRCENSKDCPPGSHCSFKGAHKYHATLGICRSH